MPNRIIQNLSSFLGKSVGDICQQGFHDAEANHCAHFVSHVGGYQFGFLCHAISGSSRKGVSVRVQELFPHCPEVGEWEDRPDTDDDLLVFITARRNVNLARKTIQNVPKKHIGILRKGEVFHYSNGEDKVVRQSPAAVRERFRRTYRDSTVDLFFGTLPIATRAISRTLRSRDAREVLKLKLVRNTFTKTSTIGELSVSGRFECFILEDPIRPEKIAGVTAIPSGVYSIVITRSPRFGRDLPLLEDVPGFEGIRIHPGNSVADAEGSLLPGRNKATDFVGKSRAAFAALFEKLRKAEESGKRIEIEITERGESPFARKRVVRRKPPQRHFRVLADPLRVRSSSHTESNDNVIGSLPFGEIVSSTKPDAPPEWIAVKTIHGKREPSGLLLASYLEAVPPPGKRATGGKKAGPRSRRIAIQGPEPLTRELFRVKSDSANLRKVAGVLHSENVVASLPRGHLVAKIGDCSKPMWWEVRTILHNDELEGFLHSGLLTADAGAVDAGSEVKVSERALQMILQFEGMDQPSKWPGNQSGISLGHGYDLGFHIRDELMGDWGPFLTEGQLRRLAKAIGKTGVAAKNIAPNYTDITIKRADADTVFRRDTLPKIKLWAAKAFPGVTALPADAQGALVSLVFNRGTDMNGNRRREMREIRDAVAAPSLSLKQKLNRIAESIRSMKRLWPNTLGPRRRREAEAALVESAT
jgi:GH24 family phage-related lysozyme (muramidase)